MTTTPTGAAAAPPDNPSATSAASAVGLGPPILARLSLRARLTLWLLVLLLAWSALSSAVIYFAFAETTLQHLDGHVEEEMIEFRNIAKSADPGEGWRRTAELESRPDRRNFFSIRILDDQGREVVASGVFRRPAWRRFEFGEFSEPITLEDPPRTLADEADDAVDWRLYYETLTDTADRPYRMHLAVDLSYLQRYSRLFNIAIGTVTAAGTALGVWGAWWLAGRSLRPLKRVAERMQSVGLRSLEERLPAPMARDEVAALVASFNGMLSRLQVSVERLQQFTADAAHELRTPVAAALTAVEVALRRERTAEEYRQALAGLMPALEQLATLGRDMGVLAEADADRVRLDYADADINAVVGEMAEFLQPVAEEHGLQLAFVPTDRPAVRCDVARLRQVLFNLLDNATKYTPAGRVTVSIDGDDATARIHVADTGPGIEPVHLDKLFDRFYRVDRTRNRKTGGSGLGLAICRSLVQAHGGTLTVRSRTGAGSVFTVSLPRRPAGAAPTR